jgi:murein L,D-transpeptidase YcbB/YkuD
VIGPNLHSLVADARVTREDVTALREQVTAGDATVTEVRALASAYVDALDAGVGDALFALLRELGGGTLMAEPPIADLSEQPGLLSGLVRLPEAGERHPAVMTVQRGLIALASRTGDNRFMLPTRGADGDYGPETRAAVSAFQRSHGLEPTGDVDLPTAQSLDGALRRTRVPAIFAVFG